MKCIWCAVAGYVSICVLFWRCNLASVAPAGQGALCRAGGGCSAAAEGQPEPGGHPHHQKARRDAGGVTHAADLLSMQLMVARGRDKGLEHKMNAVSPRKVCKPCARCLMKTVCLKRRLHNPAAYPLMLHILWCSWLSMVCVFQEDPLCWPSWGLIAPVSKSASKS